MESEKLIFAIGNPLLDISAECSAELIEKYGLQSGLACLAEPKHKDLFDELWNLPHVEKIPGGAAMNVLRCANFMLKETKPHSCLYFGSIADDERGTVLKNALDNEKIEHDFSITDETYTGACAVLITEKNRTLCADLAACLKYNTDHLVANIERLKQYKILYTTGFFLSSNAEALKKVAEFSTENNILMAFNLSAVFLIHGYKQDYLDIIEQVEIVFGNEDECDAFGVVHEVGSTDRRDIAKYIARLPKKDTTLPRTVIITQGAEETIIAVHDFEKDETTITTHPVEKLSQEELVDTNSAGDSFAGGYLAARALGHSHETAMKAAAYCAKYIIQTSGCSFPRPCEFEYPELS
jgi:adenosine kinase